MTIRKSVHSEKGKATFGPQLLRGGATLHPLFKLFRNLWPPTGLSWLILRDTCQATNPGITGKDKPKLKIASNSNPF